MHPGGLLRWRGRSPCGRTERQCDRIGLRCFCLVCVPTVVRCSNLMMLACESSGHSIELTAARAAARSPCIGPQRRPAASSLGAACVQDGPFCSAPAAWSWPAAPAAGRRGAVRRPGRRGGAPRRRAARRGGAAGARAPPARGRGRAPARPRRAQGPGRRRGERQAPARAAAALPRDGRRRAGSRAVGRPQQVRRHAREPRGQPGGPARPAPARAAARPRAGQRDGRGRWRGRAAAQGQGQHQGADARGGLAAGRAVHGARRGPALAAAAARRRARVGGPLPELR